jgi:peptidoglycan/LPS O-acetylase OafA/YrhL
MESNAGGYSLGYRPELDGVRGVAILLVLLYHSGCPYTVGGAVGVDLFFVLSGFLITTTLLEERRARGQFSFARFYARRFLRLAPALLLLVAIYCAISLVLSDNPTHHLLDALFVVGYVSNWTRALGIDRPALLGHTWSLSIEEQFYLLWPPCLALLYRYIRSTLCNVGFLLAAVVAVMMLRPILLAAGVTPERIYNGLDTRADLLLLGCALAVGASAGMVRPVRDPVCGPALSLIACVGIATFAVLTHWRDAFMLAWGYSVMGLLSTLLVLQCLGDANNSINRLLRLGPLVWVGKLSYGLYLWHYPIMAVMVARRDDWRIVALGGGLASVLIATASYYLVERPCLRLKRRFRAT